MCHVRVSVAPPAMKMPIGRSAGICARRSGSTGPSPVWLDVNSAARTAPVVVSIARSTLRQCLRRAGPCDRTCHGPSPSILERTVPSPGPATPAESLAGAAPRCSWTRSSCDSRQGRLVHVRPDKQTDPTREIPSARVTQQRPEMFSGGGHIINATVARRADSLGQFPHNLLEKA